MRYFEIIKESTEAEISDKLFRYSNFSGEAFKTKIGKRIADLLMQKAKTITNDLDSQEAYDFITDEIRPIDNYLSKLLRQAHDRNQNMKEWFDLEHKSLDQILQAAIESRNAIAASYDEDEEEEDYRLEDHRQKYFDSLTGFSQYYPDIDNMHFLRFGPPRKGGRSIFGLAGDDTEDEIDQWRLESGNKTHEAGVSVLVANRHPNDPEGWIINMPDFSKAKYSVPSDNAYIYSILPRQLFNEWHKNRSTKVAFLIHGSVVTVKSKYGPVAELGSDGEYLIDTIKPFKSTPIPLEKIYLSENKTLVDWLDSLDFWKKIQYEE